MQRRIPGTMSGAPGIDQLFIQIWWATAAFQLWGFLFVVTKLTVREGALVSSIVFGGLLFLFVAAVAVGMGFPMALRQRQ